MKSLAIASFSLLIMTRAAFAGITTNFGLTVTQVGTSLPQGFDPSKAIVLRPTPAFVPGEIYLFDHEPITGRTWVGVDLWWHTLLVYESTYSFELKDNVLKFNERLVLSPIYHELFPTAFQHFVMWEPMPINAPAGIYYVQPAPFIPIYQGQTGPTDVPQDPRGFAFNYAGAVPEPSSFLIFAGITAGLLRRSRTANRCSKHRHAAK